MQRRNTGLFFFKSLKILVAAAFLAAMSMVFGKFLAIPLGDVLRFSFENTPIILAGVIFGPLVGGAVGCVADLVGCVAVGYTINPIVTIGAALIGIISGLVMTVARKLSVPNNISYAAAVTLSHLIGSVIVKTVGLAAFYQMSFEVLLLWRLINYAAVGTMDGMILILLLKNKSVLHAINSIKR